MSSIRRVAAIVAGAAAAIPAVGHLRWRHASSLLQHAVLSGARTPSTDSVEHHGTEADAVLAPERLAGLPEPVVRFFRRAIPAGAKQVRTAHVEQRGEFFLNGQWLPMRARQVFAARPPAFMWDARITMAGVLPVYVRDAYAAGRASMQAQLVAVYPIVDQAGTPELNAGALMRYLGEAGWLPTALLPGDGLSWEPIDADRARATLVDGRTAVSLEFRFNAEGDIVELYSPARFREVNGDYVPTPWRVRILGYDTHDGFRVTTPSVAEWILPEGPLPYWRGRLTSVTYTY